MSTKGRGWLSSIDKLPDECQPIVAWAAKELANLDRTQTDVYQEFKTKLIALQGEQGVDFDIPHFRSFSRYSVRLASLSKTVEQARQIASTLADRFDAAGSDNLTIVAAEALKSLVLEAALMASGGNLTSKSAAEFSTALKNLAAAQSTSANRRLKLEAEAKARKAIEDMNAKAEKALDVLSNEPGISKEAIARARREFLGVRAKPKKDGET
ncbi:hypothetical protein QE369_002978 [Agrobacterium larrymoorei]|uniref:DUF3486 family protein n=1 Tax=Agrobacterium larrymoorei TaxID=160699 RepID=A0AAJ2BAS4_9HYPH|nr:phage protein Gp27 family protein [Agrobacterium larrymoorei]MDR6102781.1 hypothetical protein [Agrobacterium larrymoorei]